MDSQPTYNQILNRFIYESEVLFLDDTRYPENVVTDVQRVIDQHFVDEVNSKTNKKITVKDVRDILDEAPLEIKTEAVKKAEADVNNGFFLGIHKENGQWVY